MNRRVVALLAWNAVVAGLLAGAGLVHVQRTARWERLGEPTETGGLRIAVPNGWAIGTPGDARPRPTVELVENGGRRRVIRAYRVPLLNEMRTADLLGAPAGGEWGNVGAQRPTGLWWAEGSSERGLGDESTAALAIAGEVVATPDGPVGLRVELAGDRPRTVGDPVLLRKVFSAAAVVGAVEPAPGRLGVRRFRGWLGDGELTAEAARRCAVAAEPSLAEAAVEVLGEGDWLFASESGRFGDDPPEATAVRVVSGSGGDAEVIVARSVAGRPDAARAQAVADALAAAKTEGLWEGWLGVALERGENFDRAGHRPIARSDAGPVVFERSVWHRDDANPFVGWMIEKRVNEPLPQVRREARWRNPAGDIEQATVLWTLSPSGIVAERSWTGRQGLGAGSDHGVEPLPGRVPGYAVAQVIAGVREAAVRFWTDSLPFPDGLCPPVPLGVLASPADDRIRVADDGSGPLRCVQVEVLSTGVRSYWYFKGDGLEQIDLPGGWYWRRSDDLDATTSDDPELVLPP